MTRVRLLLGEMPSLLHDILRDAIAGAAEVELVGDVSAPEGVESAIRSHNPDVVLIAPTTGDERRAVELLRVAPHVRVVSIVAGGHGAAIYELRPHRSVLEDVSLRAVLDAIRAERAFPIVAPFPP